MTVETHAPGGCDAGWANCANAQVDDAAYAEATSLGQEGEWYDYGFSIPTGYVINAVRVLIKGHVGHAANECDLRVWNGSVWGAWHKDVTPGTVECEEHSIDVSGDFVWTPAMVNAIRVELRYNVQGGPPPSRYCRCCYLPVQVDYTGVVETIVAQGMPMHYLSEPPAAKELTSKVSGATITHVAKDFPEALLKKGRAKELRSKWS